MIVQITVNFISLALCIDLADHCSKSQYVRYKIMLPASVGNFMEFASIWLYFQMEPCAKEFVLGLQEVIPLQWSVARLRFLGTNLCD